jgi:RNA polymerase sigma-70 factor, ECF subfamily
MESQLSISTSTGLLERVKIGDADAWRRLARLYSPLVYRWARTWGMQPNDAADVVQETFAAVARGIDGFRADLPQSSFRGWLWTIARNQVRLHYRRDKGRPHALGGSDARLILEQQPDFAAIDDDSEISEFSSHASLVHRAVQLIRGDFQPQTWQAFWRVVVEDRLAVEVAEELGMTPAAVRQAKYRVLCRLHEELKQG